ncbi:hypothetical protein C475_19233 [Halosimplex carlsbadense 2-9-1]|uniref:DUF8001 domain-containing protein n=1 Tax=Halosimplex carlsbadense 2-9-1 TaxID=797114 RepID=M0CEQ8_9EURY|nr:hypothetical protein [Halosimplex carlsbadense]ELZ21123.1 hypothetical protein C475_19233 [Halosimplex carlsbadense 2-9-1]
MTDPPTVTPGEMDTDTLLETIKQKGHVVVRTEFLDSDYDVTLRWDGETFYCDTPTRLHHHDTEQGMRTCIEEQGYSE